MSVIDHEQAKRICLFCSLSKRIEREYINSEARRKKKKEGEGELIRLHHREEKEEQI